MLLFVFIFVLRKTKQFCVCVRVCARACDYIACINMTGVICQHNSYSCVLLCDVARVHAMCAVIRSVQDQKVIISFAFIYLELVKHRLSGNDTVFVCSILFLQAAVLSYI